MSTTLTRPGNRMRRTLAGALTTALAASTLALLPSSAQAEAVPVAKVTVSKTSFLPDGTQSVTVTGTGFDPALATGTRPPFAGKQSGAYIAFGRYADVWRASTGAPTSARVNPSGSNGNGAAVQWAVPLDTLTSSGMSLATTGFTELKADGSFTTTLKVNQAWLASTPGNFGIYTYAGSGTNVAAYETYTPITFAQTSSTSQLSVPTSVRYGAGSTATVAVPAVNGIAATGTVTLSGAVAQTAALTNGTATFALPKTLSAGSKALTASYSGDVNYKASSASATLRITKANVTVKRNKIKKAPTSKKAGKTTLTVKSTSGGPAVTGKVKVTFKKKGKKTKTKTVTIKNGKGNVTIPKLAKGTWKITVKYNGTSNFNKTATKKAGSVKVKK